MKFKPGELDESPSEAAVRGVLEELGSAIGHEKTHVEVEASSYHVEQEEKFSRSYPGLLTRCKFH